jgi:hypothetical protein
MRCRRHLDVIAFTELGPFIDMPFRAYSAGMRARLDFAISTAIQAEILLLDEGLGAGDASFIEKATPFARARLRLLFRAAPLFGQGERVRRRMNRKGGPALGAGMGGANRAR